MNSQRNARTNTTRFNTFSDDIQSIVETVINEYMTVPQSRPSASRARPFSNTNTNTNTQGETYVEYMSLLHAIRDAIIGYNTNMREYSQNISLFLSIIQGIQQDLSRIRAQQNRNQNMENTFDAEEPAPRPPNNTRRNTPQASAVPPNRATESRNTHPNRTGTTANLLYFNDSIYRPVGNSFLRDFVTLFPGLNTTQENVIVRPSEQQIATATEEFLYTSNTNVQNTSCPITLDDFQEGDALKRILYCGHTFRKSAIDNWFREKVRCPVCRYDIRDYVPPEEPDQPIRPGSPISIASDSPIVTEPQQEDTEFDFDVSMNSTHINSILNQVTTNFTNILQNYYNDNPESELVYSIEVSQYNSPVDASTNQVDMDNSVD
jgi:Ring finger domain